jgi:hypothetical protein
MASAVIESGPETVHEGTFHPPRSDLPHSLDLNASKASELISKLYSDAVCRCQYAAGLLLAKFDIWYVLYLRLAARTPSESSDNV